MNALAGGHTRSRFRFRNWWITCVHTGRRQDGRAGPVRDHMAQRAVAFMTGGQLRPVMAAIEATEKDDESDRASDAGMQKSRPVNRTV